MSHLFAEVDVTKGSMHWCVKRGTYSLNSSYEANICTMIKQVT